MRLGEFSSAHATAKRRIQREGIAAVGPAEQELRELLPQLASDDDRRVATNLINRLPSYAVPPDSPSPLMQEALAVERAAAESVGSADELIAVMAEARKKIFEIADQAPIDEAPGIRALARVLEHLENNLRDPHWPLDGPQDSSS